MRLFRIIITNYGGAEVYNNVTEAEDENTALKMVLAKEVVYDGDTINIEEE